MKMNIYSWVMVALLLMATGFNFSLHAQQTPVEDTVSMSAGYANEIYYSLPNGAVRTSPRNTWDIAFRTSRMSSGIITNDGSGVILYTYPKADTAGWSSVDTTGLFAWTPMYNDPDNWENGAFCRNATGHPDYGWGIYNSITHDVVGDSLFIIKLMDGSFKKLWIIQKHSAAATFTFRYADLDGANQKDTLLDFINDGAYDYMGYAFNTATKVEFQAPKADYDILFTKYMSVQSEGSPYPVTGVLNNEGLKTKNFHPVPLNYGDWGVGEWDSTRSSIGWNWKVFDMITYTYNIVDSSLYFIKAMNGDIYKLYFTSFAGTGTGKISFVKEKVAGVGFNENSENSINVAIYPNPARNRVNLYITGQPGDALSVSLTDLSGRQLHSGNPGTLTEGLNAYSMDVTGFHSGVYFVTVSTAATRSIIKVIIAN